jgi:hypothetical protein
MSGANKAYCSVPGCPEPIGRRRHKYCDLHGPNPDLAAIDRRLDGTKVYLAMRSLGWTHRDAKIAVQYDRLRRAIGR